MLPAALISTYQQYKKDTNFIASWLASTARSIGFSLDLLSPDSNYSKKQGRGGRMKGKARIQAKKLVAEAPSATNTSSSHGPKYIIGIKDFITLAEYLAEKSFLVPRLVFATLDRVIAARTKFSSQLEVYGNIVDKKQDAQHVHFVDGKKRFDAAVLALSSITVLKEVRHILSCPVPSIKRERHGKGHESSSSRDPALPRRYLCAIIRGPPVHDQHDPEEHDYALYEAEIPNSLEDAMFAFMSLIDDMDQMRSRIKWIWSNYAVGLFDVVSAAVATDTAIGLVRNMIDDILPLLQLHGGFYQMIHLLYLARCKQSGFKENEESDANNYMEKFNCDTYDVARDTYLVAFQLLKTYVDGTELDKIPLNQEGKLGYYDPKSHRFRRTGPRNFHDDRALITPFLTELLTVVAAARDWPIQDEFLRSMTEFKETKTVPLCAVFCTQVFLDITYKLGEMIEQPCQIMTKQLSFISNDIQAHLDFHKDLKTANWPAENDKNLRRVKKSITSLLEDPLIQAQNRSPRLAGAASLENPFSIFRMSPVMSGLTLYHFRCLYRDIGLHVANAWGSIQYCEHLYNMLHQNARLSARWLDMDIAKTLLSADDNFYVGSATPKTLPDQLKMFCLQMGVSAATLANRKRKGSPMGSKAGPRGIRIESVAPVHGMFELHYRANAALDITPEQLTQIIELSTLEAEAQEGDGCIMGQIEDPQKLKAKKKLRQQAHQPSKQKKRADGPLVPPDQMIKRLVMALDAEKIELTYPYLHFHRWCWRLLRAVEEKCDSILRQAVGPAYLETESQLPFVVGYILMIACDRTSETSSTLPINQAAEALQEMIESGVGSFTTMKILGEVLGLPVSIVSER